MKKWTAREEPKAARSFLGTNCIRLMFLMAVCIIRDFGSIIGSILAALTYCSEKKFSAANPPVISPKV